MRYGSLLSITAFIFSVAALLTACSAGQSSLRGAAAHPDAKTLRNPIEPNEQSLGAGKRLYERLCANCHGETGNGVSETADTLGSAGSDVRPSDLTDDHWDHGSTDGEIFVNIRDGVGSNGVMRGLNGKPGIADREMWDIVNYVRTLKK